MQQNMHLVVHYVHSSVCTIVMIAYYWILIYYQSHPCLLLVQIICRKGPAITNGSNHVLTVLDYNHLLLCQIVSNVLYDLMFDAECITGHYA